MPLTRPMAGVALDTTLRTIVENPAGSGVIRTFEIVFVSTDPAADVTFNACRRAGTTATRPILPTGYVLGKGKTVTRKVVLGPGDRIEGNVSAAGDVEADVQQVYEEAA